MEVTNPHASDAGEPDADNQAIKRHVSFTLNAHTCDEEKICGNLGIPV